MKHQICWKINQIFHADLHYYNDALENCQTHTNTLLCDCMGSWSHISPTLTRGSVPPWSPLEPLHCLGGHRDPTLQQRGQSWDSTHHPRGQGTPAPELWWRISVKRMCRTFVFLETIFFFSHSFRWIPLCLFYASLYSSRD